ncbi:MAG: hypothetical protein WC821_04745 [archaeon]|jgi:hypothetical protein
MDEKTFEKIFELAKPFLLEGKPEDLMHAQSVLESVKLLADNKEQLDILIPFAILHDTGNSFVLPEDFHYIQGKTIVENGKLFHCLAGAKIASKILTQVNYDKEKTKEIIELIKVHDFEDTKLFKTRVWQIAKDADCLDRMNIPRLKGMMKTRNMTPPQILDLLKSVKLGFFTKNAIDEFNKRQNEFFNEFSIDKKLMIQPENVGL